MYVTIGQILTTVKGERGELKSHLSKLSLCRLSEGVQIFPSQMFLLGIKAGEE